MSNLVEGSKARVVDLTPSDGIVGNALREWPVTTAPKKGYVEVGGVVRLLHGPFKDNGGGIWWVVRVEKDPLSPSGVPNPSDVSKVGWMAQITPGTGEVNLQ
jgi:hypothetical protein